MTFAEQTKHRHSWEFIRTQTRQRYSRDMRTIHIYMDAVIKCRHCGKVSVRAAKPGEGSLL